MEPLTQESGNHYTFLPIKHQYAYDMYKQLIGNFWTAQEIDLEKDYTQLMTLSPEQQMFVKMVNAFFSSSDGIVNENIIMNFCTEIKDSSIRAYYTAQAFNESIHSETYSLIIDSIERDPIEKDKLLNAIFHFDGVKKKADFCKKYMRPFYSLAKRLMAFIIVEGIFFSGSFCAIAYLRTLNKCPGICQANELIMRDEGIHVLMGIYLYKQCRNKLSKDEVMGLFIEAVEIEKEFINESMPCSLLGMNADLMSQYIEYVCDRTLSQIGYEKIYEVSNPFYFMEAGTSIEGKTNFFDKKNTSYVKSELNEGEFSLDAEF
jgi:ribonucleoside-diphosphate reductase beta chain